MEHEQISAQERQATTLQRVMYRGAIVLGLGFLSGGVYLGGRIVPPLLESVQSLWNSPLDMWGSQPYIGVDDVVYTPPPPEFDLAREARLLREARAAANPTR
jgi:hypothetical protein